MGKPNFSDNFKRDAMVQITEREYSVTEVSHRLGCLRRYGLTGRRKTRPPSPEACSPVISTRRNRWADRCPNGSPQKSRMELVVRTIGLARTRTRTRIKIRMANLAYNFQRLA